MKKILLLLSMLLVAFICFAQVPAGPNWVTFERTSATTGTVRWSAEPSAFVALYYISLAPDDVLYMPEPGGPEPPWNSGILPGWDAPLEVFLESPGVYRFDHPLMLDPTKEYIAYVAANNAGWTWNVSSSYHNPRLADFPSGESTGVIGGHTIMPSVDLNYAPDQNLALFPSVTNPSFSPLYSVVLSGSGMVDIQILTPANWGACYHTGNWHYQEAIGGAIMFDDVNFDAKGNVAIFLGNEDPTLPVELSSFSAILTASNFVSLKWTSESETEMLGYRVYRSETNNVNSALMISPIMIPATNTSSTQNYGFDDYEVEINTTYWYWLESIDFGSSHMYGPSSVSTAGGEPNTPSMPENTGINKVYPNPFRTGSAITLDLNVKAGENAEAVIYNSRGQRVKTMYFTEGNHQVMWDGKDINGNSCSSGLYFFRLMSESARNTRKLLLMK